MDGYSSEKGGHPHIGRYCLWWRWGFCSNLDLLKDYETETGESRTFLPMAEDCTCRYWDLGYLLNEAESPGPRSSIQSISASPDISAKPISPVDEVGETLTPKLPPASKARISLGHKSKGSKDLNQLSIDFDDMENGEG